MSRRTLKLLGLAVTALLGVLVAAQPAYADHPAGTIVFSSDVGGLPQLYTMSTDGSGMAPLTSTPDTVDFWPEWSADRTKVVFSRVLLSEEDNTEIFVVNRDGSGLRRLTTDAAVDNHPTWTPDGSRIIFDSNRNDPSPATCRSTDLCRYDLFTIDADGTNLRQLTTSTGADSHPKVSPDGTRVAFTSNRSGANAVWTMSIDGSGLRQLTPNSMIGGLPNWSPDGKRIIFENNSCSFPTCAESDLFTMKATTGSVITQLTRNFGNNVDADYSPDGKFIIFQHSDSVSTKTDVYITWEDGSHITNITNSSTVSDFTPNWGA